MTKQQTSKLPLNGVLLLDKPLGLSSQQALGRAKHLFCAAKAGHTGTLDPLATGLLPLCFGEATKFSQGLLNADKTYEADIYLGRTTTTGDAEGDLLNSLPVNVTLLDVQLALRAFVGELMQLPPMYSALKKDGKPLYFYARQGATIEREARPIVIHRLELLAFTTPIIKVRVQCSKGTYIRTLAEDIGLHLGCGAHLTALRRTAVAALDVAQAMTLTAIEHTPQANRQHLLAPLDILIQDLYKLDLDKASSHRFLLGQRLAGWDHLSDGVLRVYDGDSLLGLAQCQSGVLRPQRLVQQNRS